VRILCAWTVALSLAMAVPAAAQTPAQPPPQTPPAPAEQEQPPIYTEAVVVTASKVEQQLVNAPATVSVVSSDVIGNAHSCVFDSLCTSVMQGSMVKVLGWYDNEWGFSSRLVDLVDIVAASL